MQPLDIRRQQNLPRSRRRLVEMLKIRRFINRLNICKSMLQIRNPQ